MIKVNYGSLQEKSGCDRKRKKKINIAKLEAVIFELHHSFVLKILVSLTDSRGDLFGSCFLET